jgi:hypothetical protein
MGALLREPVCPSLREQQITAGRMHGDPAVRDRGFNRKAIFLVAPTGIAEELVYRSDV